MWRRLHPQIANHRLLHLNSQQPRRCLAERLRPDSLTWPFTTSLGAQHPRALSHPPPAPPCNPVHSAPPELPSGLCSCRAASYPWLLSGDAGKALT